MTRLIALVAALSVVVCGCAPPAVAPVTSRLPEPIAVEASVSPTPPTVAEPSSAASTPSPTPFAFPPCGTPIARAGDDPMVRAACVPGARIDIDAAIDDVDAAAIVVQVSDDLA